jgi:long-chain acyl-CoA synthetase
VQTTDLERLGLRSPLHRVPIPFGPQSFRLMLDRSVRERPHAEALVGRCARYNYEQLHGAVAAAAAGLSAIGIRPFDRVAASTGNHPDIVIAFLASQWIGAIWVGINRAYTPFEKLNLLVAGQVTLLLGDGATLDALVGVNYPDTTGQGNCRQPMHSDSCLPDCRATFGHWR